MSDAQSRGRRVPIPVVAAGTAVAAPAVQEARAGFFDGAHTEGHLTALPPLSLYLHMPWCLRKCPYCDFNSHEWRSSAGSWSAQPETDAGVVHELGRADRSVPDAVMQTRYCHALIRDLEVALPQIWGRTVHSIFIGGGTPSLFEPQHIEALLADIRARLRLEPG
jgi:oxygen-independent coproporphyrinogen-3 oxidase